MIASPSAGMNTAPLGNRRYRDQRPSSRAKFINALHRPANLDRDDSNITASYPAGLTRMTNFSGARPLGSTGIGSDR